MRVLDTAFLIDLQREWARGEAGPATRFLREHAQEECGVSVVSVLEFLEGYQSVRDGEAFLEPFVWIDVTARVARSGSRLRRDLHRAGHPIGDFDVLIAATALEAGATLVTADARHFQRVEGLCLETYRS